MAAVTGWDLESRLGAALGPQKTGAPRTAADSGGQPTPQVSNGF
jgi:hypothetical protein